MALTLGFEAVPANASGQHYFGARRVTVTPVVIMIPGLLAFETIVLFNQGIAARSCRGTISQRYFAWLSDVDLDQGRGGGVEVQIDDVFASQGLRSEE